VEKRTKPEMADQLGQPEKLYDDLNQTREQKLQKAIAEVCHVHLEFGPEGLQALLQASPRHASYAMLRI
jgi:hypothetical protein